MRITQINLGDKMKKIRGAVLFVVAILSCLVFSACKTDYSGLSISFYSTDGEAISGVNLILDELETTSLAVRFDGIDEQDIGEISVRTEPMGIADVTIDRREGNTYFLTVNANIVSETSASIVVMHDSSKKSASLPLFVYKRSTENAITLKTDRYYIPINDTRTNTTIDASEILSIDGTEKIYFTLTGDNDLNGINAIREEINDESLITGFGVNNSVETGRTITLNPVLVIEGAENRELTNHTFTVEFVRQFTDDEIVLTTDDYHEQYINNEPIVLVVGDYTDVTTTVGAKYNYNNVQLELRLVGEEDEGNLSLVNVDGINFYDYYEIIENYNQNLPIRIDHSGNKVIITATDYIAQETEIEIILSPKGEGGLNSVTKTISIMSVIKPSNIDMTMLGEAITSDEVYNLYDYYPNSLGARFNFSTVEESYVDFSNMRIQVIPQLLNIDVEYGGSIERVIYTDDTFIDRDIRDSVEHEDGTTTQFSNNVDLLEFYIGSAPLKFYYDETLDRFISQTITSADSVYVKYVRNDMTEGVEDNYTYLSYDIFVYYSGDLRYLEGISLPSSTLRFNGKDGVSDITINAGYIDVESPYDRHLYQENNVSIEVDSLYLDRTQGIDSTGTTYFISMGQVLGEQGNDLESAEFRVEVSGGDASPLEIKQYEAGDGNGKGVTGELSINFEYNRQQSIYNNILLIFDSDTDIDDYVITIYFPNYDGGENGYVEINCKVYQKLTNENVSYDLEENSTAFKNFVGYDTITGEAQYLFADYKADYIVASGQSLDLEIKLDEVYELVSYSYILTYDGGDNYNATDFVTVRYNGELDSNPSLSFHRGTFVDEIRYITLNIEIEVENYPNIYTVDGTVKESITIVFFVYEELQLNDISASITYDGQTVSGTRVTRYMYDSLGVYDKNLASATLNINLINPSLWNYIQSGEQTGAIGVVGNSSGTQTGEGEEGAGDGTENSVNNYFKVVWRTDSANAPLIYTETQGNNSVSLRFNTVGTISSYTCIIYATFTQFNSDPFNIMFTITVERPVLTESIQITSELNTLTENGTEYYLNLKAGEDPYTITYKSFSSEGDVTSSGIYMVVVDRYGNKNNSVSISGNSLSVRSNLVSGNNLRLIVFARDVLNVELGDLTSGYNYPTDFILNGPTSDPTKYYDAYIEIQLILSNGTESNPYAIFNAEDFWEINDSELMKSAHYMLMTNINISNTNYIGSKVIDGFTGSITTFSQDDNTQYVFTISGVVLNNTNRNLFTNFNGSITNINFNVTYEYEINSNSALNLGVIDVNNGSLLNTTLTTNGSSSSVRLNGENSTIYFGGLVGVNEGEIEYTSNSIVGVTFSGTLNITGDAIVYFGGLVGNNDGSIKGFDDASGTTTLDANASEMVGYSQISNIIFGIYLGNDGALADININSNLTNNRSAVGGIIGINSTNATLENAYVLGNIISSHSNVGGVIGYNEGISIDGVTPKVVVTTDSGSTITNVSVDSSNYNFYNITSLVKMSSTGDNVGGVTGLDEYGIYRDVHYQIQASTTTSSIVGVHYVGGIIGNATNSYLESCSVYSYRFDYSNCTEITGNADIVGQNYVAGLIGGANAGIMGGVGAGSFDTTAIVKSSANAYIKVINSGIESAGLVNSIRYPDNSVGSSILFNVAFIGKLDGRQTNELVVSNITNQIGYRMFSVNGNSLGTEPIIATDPINWNISKAQDGSDSFDADGNIWGYDASTNGGYIYIKGSDDNPIFERIPNSVTVSSKEYDGAVILDGNSIYLEYYNYYSYVEDENNNNSLTRSNRHSLYELLNFEVDPEDLENVRLSVTSSNSNVVMISNSYILLRGTGYAEIRFTSPLNNSISQTVRIYVGYPIGDRFVISKSSVDESLSINGEDVNIAKGYAEQFYTISSGERYGYEYQTNSTVNLHIEVDTALVGVIDNLSDYLNISGITFTKKVTNVDGTDVISDNIWVADLDYDIPFSITVLESVDNDAYFEFTLTPYIVVAGHRIEFENQIQFNLYTYRGASNISVDYNSLILYPNDKTSVTANITTDKALETEDEFLELVNIYLDDNIQTDLTSYITNINLGELVSETGIQKVTFDVVFPTTIDTTTRHDLDLNFTIDGVERANIGFTLLPQRINSIEIKNYIRENNSWIESDIIKSGTETDPDVYGLMVINIAPVNGYYDYLEISDITGQELIVFAQVDKDGNRLGVDLPSSDGLGIILNNTSDTNTIYVRTRISREYSSIEHTIQVRAYVRTEGVGDVLVSPPRNIIITARMMPSIVMNYIRPDGTVESTQTTRYLAIGTINDFLIYATNADNTVPTFSYTLVDNSNNELNFEDYFYTLSSSTNFYELTPREGVNMETLLGGTLTITANAVLTNENGDYDTATKSISFKFTNFVIHDVSISHSVNNGHTLYGNNNSNTNFYFYFDSNDVSFAGASGDDIEYNPDISEGSGIIYYLNQILAELNSNIGILELLEFSGFDNDNITITENVLTLLDEDDSNVLTITQNDNFTYTIRPSGLVDIDEMTLKFYLNLVDNYWEFSTEENPTNQANYSQISYNIDYELNFTDALTDHETNLVTTALEFLNMESGTGYTLGNDIVLENYTPLDVDLTYFDGNGHTITIRNFSVFTDADIQAGLFSQVYEDMLVMNLTVEYSRSRDTYNFGSYSRTSSSFDVTYYNIAQSAEVDYESVTFGGITPSNSGIITNCKVKGLVALTAPTVEAKVEDLDVSFYIGGLVGNNNSTGYITNSTSELQIFAKANIGGLAYSNAGKISSSAFNANTSSTTNPNGYGLIYAYNRTNSYNSVIEVAGFVVNNTGEISMSYVESGVNYCLINGMNYYPIGNISAKDISAGFVYNNAGTIYDSYVVMEQVGDNSNNIFSGFVSVNSSTIEKCYTMINNGNKSSSIVNMFAPSGTTGIENSYEIKSYVSGYQDGIDGLEQIEYNNRLDRTRYAGFTFGDNENAVWTMGGSLTPKLVSTLETVEYTRNEAPSGSIVTIEGVQYSQYYYGLRTIRREDEPILDNNNNIIGYTYRWIVSDNGYGEKENPILIYDLDSYQRYFIEDNMTKYFRFIADIDFSSLYASPTTSSMTFSGNIQGNNVDIDGLMIYSQEDLSSIGLFRNITVQDSSVANAVRNLDINASSLLASRTSAVGILAGIIEDYKLYNIDLSADDVVVGSNAVGGLAGIVRGRFDIETISSTVSVNSVRASTQYQYAVYKSKNNGAEVSSNIEEVYYAGSIAGILDGYDSRNYSASSTRTLVDSNYFIAEDISVSGNLTVIGDTIGSAFGMIGERVKVNNATVELTGGILYGYQYSAGLVGENRGWITSANVVSTNADIFNNSNNVNAGLVGFNMGGVIMDSQVELSILKTNTTSTAGGIVGRNLYGYIHSVDFNGELLSFYTGGIIGADYTFDTFNNRTTGVGSIDNNSKSVLPTRKEDISYNYQGRTLSQYNDLKLSLDTIQYLVDNMSDYYSYSLGAEDFSSSINYGRVLGLFVGIADNQISYADTTYAVIGNNFVINYDTSSSSIINSQVGLINDANLYTGATYDLPYSNIFKVGAGSASNNIVSGINVDYTYVTYFVGVSVGSFDSWSRRGYSAEIIVFTPSSTEIIEPILRIDLESIGTDINSDNIYEFDTYTATNLYVSGGRNSITLRGDTSNLAFDPNAINRYYGLEENETMLIFKTAGITDEGTQIGENSRVKLTDNEGLFVEEQLIFRLEITSIIEESSVEREENITITFTKLS